MKKKLLYEAPETSTFEVQIEGVICQSGTFGINDWQDDGDPLSF